VFISRTVQDTVYIAIEEFLADNEDIGFPQMEFSMQIGVAGDFFNDALIEWKANNYIIVKAPKDQANALDDLMSIYNFHQACCVNCLYFAVGTPIELNKIIAALSKVISTAQLEGVFKCMLVEEDGTLDYWNITKSGIELAEPPSETLFI
jgi:hypothetical protein